MSSVFSLGKLEIPVYGLLGALGVLLGILYLFLYCRNRKKSFEDTIYVYMWAAVSAIIGAKLLYLLIESKHIFLLLKLYPDLKRDIFVSYISGGFVFYGGLIGAIAGVILSSKYFSLSAKEQLNILIPTMPLIHGFGRLGCHIVGCCYGMEYSGHLSVTYTSSEFAPNNVSLFPVQLTESLFDFTLFFVFVILVLIKKYEDKFIYIYLVSYSIVRFTLEFLRGDAYRGSFLNISVSQWISIFIWIACIASYISPRLKDKKPKGHCE